MRATIIASAVLASTLATPVLSTPFGTDSSEDSFSRRDDLSAQLIARQLASDILEGRADSEFEKRMFRAAAKKVLQTAGQIGTMATGGTLGAIGYDQYKQHAEAPKTNSESSSGGSSSSHHKGGKGKRAEEFELERRIWGAAGAAKHVLKTGGVRNAAAGAYAAHRQFQKFPTTHSRPENQQEQTSSQVNDNGQGKREDVFDLERRMFRAAAGRIAKTAGEIAKTATGGTIGAIGYDQYKQQQEEAKKAQEQAKAAEQKEEKKGKRYDEYDLERRMFRVAAKKIGQAAADVAKNAAAGFGAAGAYDQYQKHQTPTPEGGKKEHPSPSHNDKGKRENVLDLERRMFRIAAKKIAQTAGEVGTMATGGTLGAIGYDQYKKQQEAKKAQEQAAEQKEKEKKGKRYDEFDLERRMFRVIAGKAGKATGDIAKNAAAAFAASAAYDKYQEQQAEAKKAEDKKKEGGDKKDKRDEFIEILARALGEIDELD